MLLKMSNKIIHIIVFHRLDRVLICLVLRETTTVN
jgi:hypothetical protein